MPTTGHDPPASADLKKIIEDWVCPRLFWTPTHSAGHGKLTDLYPVQGVELPSVFWTDLAQWINLLVESQAAELSKLQGQYAARRLTPFIERTRKVLNFEAHWWDADTRAKVQVLFAYALTIYGQQTGTRQHLEEAVTTLQGTLKEYTRERSPLDWAMTKTALGNALMRLGERERDTDTALLKAAVTAFQEALSERTRDRIPLDWAMTQNNLGMAFTRLGEREAGTADLEAAVKACQDALKEQTRERVPLDWAKTQNLLGAALKTLGEREGNTTRLEDAVTACQEALKERTRERVPLDWAMTQNNLGNALESLAEREGNTGRFEAAATAYQEALKEQKRDQVPLDWALTQNNLGVSLERLGEREGSIARLEAAVATFEEALQVWHGTSGHYEALAQNNLLRAQAALDKVRANEH